VSDNVISFPEPLVAIDPLDLVDEFQMQSWILIDIVEDALGRRAAPLPRRLHIEEVERLLALFLNPPIGDHPGSGRARRSSRARRPPAGWLRARRCPAKR
jgi:hypothetical protein